MKALVKKEKGIGHLSLEEVDMPSYRDTEVLIKVKAVGICGSDLHILHDAVPYTPPVIIGHEFSGEIVAVGKKVQNFHVGERVVAENIKGGCGTCELCRTGHECICPNRDAKGINSDGGMADYVVCDESRLYHLPDNISFEEGAMMEPVTVCCHGVLEQCHISAGDTVLISGPGTIGLIAAMVAQANGATVILVGTGSDAERLELAKQLGINHTIQLDKEDLNAVIQEITKGNGVDAVIECSGSPQALSSALWHVKFRGTVTLLGLFGKNAEINPNVIVAKELQIKGSLSHTDHAWKHAIRLVKDGLVQLKPLITHTFTLDEWEEAFNVCGSQKGIKVLFKL